MIAAHCFNVASVGNDGSHGFELFEKIGHVHSLSVVCVHRGEALHANYRTI
jgi:hypothetical protein